MNGEGRRVQNRQTPPLSILDLTQQTMPHRRVTEPAQAHVNVRGTREVWHRILPDTVQVPAGGGKVPSGLGEEVESLALWTLAYADEDMEAIFGAPPMVAEVELVSIGTDAESRVVFDAILQPDVEYVLTTTAFTGTYTTTFTGPRRSRRPEVIDGTLPLADIDAPLVRANGRGGDYTRGANADFAVSGGLTTVEKLIWHRLFTPLGSLDWAPGYGSGLRLKEMAPRDLRSEEARLRTLVEGVPGVRRAVVSILFRDDHAVVSVRAQTQFGELESERRVP